MPRKKTIKSKKTPAKEPTPIDNTTASPSADKTETSFPVVGIGASAGGLEALKQFFSEVSEDSGMAYIVVVHMGRHQPSMMPELLQKVTTLPVTTAIDSQTIAPNHIYVLPPDKNIIVYRGELQLLDILERGVLHPIDSFFKSLAQDQGRMAAAIVLSGTGTDGSLGIREIHGHEGVVFTQDEKSAAYDGMPRSAINTGMVDSVLPPNKMPKKLLEYFFQSSNILARKGDASEIELQKPLNKIFAILRTQIGHDFSSYKSSTILRRINRRMGLNQIDDPSTYVKFLQQNPTEPEALFRELLIGVTNFFRDAQSFKVLKTSILPEILGQMHNGDTFRAWVPGCSTGEEVYSLVIILTELLDSSSTGIDLQLFGTDIDSVAISKAREGLYPASIANDISKKRLERFFTREEGFYRVRKEIRDRVVFSEQNVIKDPPFSRLHLLCCRNLLIYLNTELQRKLLPLFHYTLKPDGVMVLGSSESVGGFTDLFETLDKKWKIFRRIDVPNAIRSPVDFPSGLSRPEKNYSDTTPVQPIMKTDVSHATQMAILKQFAPTAILVDSRGDILHIQGRSGKYLEPPSGPPSQNILDLAREGLRIELSSAFRAAKADNKAITRKNISIKINGDLQTIHLHVRPQIAPTELAGRFLVVFEDIEAKPDTESSGQDGQVVTEGVEPPRIAKLEKELQDTRESHQVTIEELESSNEELKSTNEELQSSNEELQSTNEELESSKEELQSLNEELHTVNAELQGKVEELSGVRDDMRNLLNSMEIATIFVDNDLCVKRFTNEAKRIVNLIPTDIGRPLKHVVSNLHYDRLESDLAEVSRSLVPVEKEVETADGDWYKMRIIPYRTTDNRIDGCVLTFSSIAEQKDTQARLTGSSNRFEHDLKLLNAAFDSTTVPTAVLDHVLKPILVNTAFSKLLKLSGKKTGELALKDIQSTIPKHVGLTSKLKKSFKDGKNFETRSFALSTPDGEQRYTIHGQTVINNEGHPGSVVIRIITKK